MPSPPPLPLLHVKHHPILDLVKQPAPGRIREDDLDVWVMFAEVGGGAREGAAGACVPEGQRSARSALSKKEGGAPAPETNASILPSVCAQISGPVPS